MQPASTPTFRHSSTKPARQQNKHNGKSPADYQRDDSIALTVQKCIGVSAKEVVNSASNKALDPETTSPEEVAADAELSPGPAADLTDVKKIKAAVGIPRQTSSSPNRLPNSLAERRRVRQ
jgi:hypothetical protein